VATRALGFKPEGRNQEIVYGMGDTDSGTIGYEEFPNEGDVRDPGLRPPGRNPEGGQALRR